MTYAALEATLQSHAADRPGEVPVARMIAASEDEIAARAAAMAEKLSSSGMTATIIEGISTFGGGSAPGASLPTRLLQLGHATLGAAALEAHLRSLETPIIARIENDRVVLDLRTVLPEHDGILTELIQRAS
jgi:L-seryl-tRNA(Ser) seleniumtransferase